LARILIIDSDASATHIATMLAVEHFVERAADAQTARFLLSATDWDVVLLDPAVRGGDGRALMRSIREMGHAPEVVVVTAEHPLDAVVQTLRAGAFEFVSKPIDDALLSRAVANAAQLRRLRDDKRRLEQHQREERAHLAALVEERTRQMQQVFANVPGVLYRQLVDGQGQRRFSFVSVGCEELFELERDVLLADAYRFDALVHPEDAARFRKARDQAEAEQGRFRFEGRFVLRSGRTKWFLCTAQPAVRVGGEVVWDGIVTDVTERNELQAQLLLADRLASVGSMAAAVAHEVYNPLAYVKSHLGSLESRLARAGADEESLGLVREVIQGVDRIDTAVSDLRTFARSGEDPRLVPLTQVIDASVRLASNEIRHRARLTRGYDSDAHVLADESTLGQLFLNLLIAVAQSIPEGEAPGYEISISTESRADGWTSVVIADTGPGLSEETLQHAFDPIESRTPTVRAGLGLYVCHRIVAGLGGRITAARGAERGNRFVVTLPTRHSGDLVELPRRTRGHDRVARVLVVDDEELVVKAMCRALEGHVVVSANSGRQAIDLLKKGEPFDLVLCDVMMPDLMGEDVYEAARSVGMESRIVFITGGAFTSAARAFLDSVPNRRIEKPFSRDRVRSLLSDADAGPVN
jgi:PAS domain S-box-containing protein